TSSRPEDSRARSSAGSGRWENDRDSELPSRHDATAKVGPRRAERARSRTMIYEGTERRRHRVYVTRNTEYHTRDGICVAVRDRTSQSFRNAHIALNLKIEGGVRVYSNGACVPNVISPLPGDAIFFTHVNADGE